MTTRKLQVLYIPGGEHGHTPRIMLQGQWLEKLGYQYGDKIEVTADGERIQIEKTGENALAQY